MFQRFMGCLILANEKDLRIPANSKTLTDWPERDAGDGIDLDGDVVMCSHISYFSRKVNVLVFNVQALEEVRWQVMNIRIP